MSMSIFGSNSISEEWRYPVADLVVSPERAKWIEERYPFSDVGRPGIIGASGIRNTDAAVPMEEVEGELELAMAAD
jgi:hypothetical protein